jgi:hypothetical protein
MEELKFPEETSSGPRSIRPRIVVVIRHVGGGLQSHLNLFLEGSKTTGREGRPDRSGLSRNIAVSDPRVRRILLPVVAFAIAAGAFAVPIYMKVNGIDGSVTLEGHQKLIDVQG